MCGVKHMLLFGFQSTSSSRSQTGIGLQFQPVGIFQSTSSSRSQTLRMDHGWKLQKFQSTSSSRSQTVPDANIKQTTVISIH